VSRLFVPKVSNTNKYYFKRFLVNSQPMENDDAMAVEGTETQERVEVPSPSADLGDPGTLFISFIHIYYWSATVHGGAGLAPSFEQKVFHFEIALSSIRHSL